MAKLVSKTYGDALFSAALESGELDRFYEEVQGLLEVLRTNKELNTLMDSPKIVKEDKVKIIEDTFDRFVSGEIVGLMTLLITKGHYHETQHVFEYFIGLVKEEKKIGIATVTAAIELSEKQKQQIEQKLLDTTRYETFEMTYEVDKSLIGGLVIRLGDRIVDSSIRTKLYELSRELKKIQIQ